MGEIAEMMLDGTLDCETGEYLGEGDGYPRTARDMRRSDWAEVFPKGMHGGRKPKDTKCPTCGKMMRGQEGLRTHTKAVHKRTEQMTDFDAEMMAALESDGEKLRQMTGEDHGPFGTHDAIERELRALCDEGKMTVSDHDEAVSRLFRAAHGIAAHGI